jgi:glycosyltransferase involved in cell wall biosynthesis
MSNRAQGDRVAVLTSVHDALDPRIFFKQCRTLAAAGFEVHLLARHPRDETRAGVRIHALPRPRSRRDRPAQWLRLLWRTLRLRPRVIHIHDPELLPLLLLLKRLTGAAAIYDAHEYYGEEVARRAWIPAPLRRPAARVTDRVESWVARRIDAVVAVNEHMAAGFRRRGARAVAIHNYPVIGSGEWGAGSGEALTPRREALTPGPSPNPGRGEPLGNGGPTDPPLPRLGVGDEIPRSHGSPSPSIGRGGRRVRASRRAAATPSPTPHPASSVVGYVGLLSPDRGLATVYEAARMLCERLPSASVRVIGRVDWEGIGDGVPRDPAAWQAAGVELAGTIPADRVPGALAGLAVGWIPFLDTPNNRRTIPLKLLEYMAAGLPVVASEIGYLAAIVRASGCGLLAPPGDAAAHADALADLLADRDRARQMGAAGRAAVERRYTWKGEGRRLVRLYRRYASAGIGRESQSAYASSWSSTSSTSHQSR